MKILIVADVYPPEVSSAAHLMRELAEGLAGRGHRVSVVTAYPCYYLDTAAQQRQFPARVNEHGVEVIRIKTLPLHKVNFIVRGISQLLLPFLFFSKIKRFVRDIDAVIVYSPPLTVGLVGKLAKRRYGARFLLNLQDIFPQNAIDLGILQNKILIAFFEWIERQVYAAADVITFHSEGGRRFLIKNKHVPESKISTFPNWIDPTPYRDLKDPISFRRQYGLEDKFIFLFAGIMGPAQGLEFLVEVAREVSDLKKVIFLVVGDGTEKGKLEKLAEQYKLKNVVFRPFVSGDEYPSLVKSTDVGVVCLSSKNKTPFIPGKFLGYMAAGKPIIAFLNKESDGFSLVKEADCGYTVKSNDLKGAEELIRKMYSEKEKLYRLGKSGFKYLSNHFTLDMCLDKLEKLLS